MPVIPSSISNRRSAPRRRAGLARAAIAIAAVLLTVLAQWGPAANLSHSDNSFFGKSFFGNEILRDAFIRAGATTDPEPRILLVDIDEASLATLGPWPWSSSRMADLVEILLSRYEARGVALDIVRPEPNDPEGDLRLGALAQHGPLVLAQVFAFGPREVPLHEGVLAGALPERQALAARADGHLANPAGFAGARHVGNIGFTPDRDGVLRHVPLVARFAGRDYPALGLALVNCCSGARLAAQPDADRMRIPYRRDWTAFTSVSAADILNESIAPDSARGRLVLVGSSSLGLGDLVATPHAASRPGLGVQAEILSALLDRQQGSTPRPWPGRLVACAFALLAALLATFAFPRLPAVASVALLGAVSALWLGVAYLFAPHDPHFSTTAPLASNLFLLAVAVPYQWQIAQRRSRHLLGTLRQYVAPEVVHELLRSDLADPLAPRQFDVTTLIADMEGYTSQVETLSMEESARLTRDFLDCLTGPVIATRGTLDKYTGDGLVAFWGAPLPNDEHADLALDAARAILHEVARFSRERAQKGLAPLRVRIGIESGPAMAGDYGTSFRSIYTAVGDSVNIASRLEQAARDYPHDVVIGEGTVALSRTREAAGYPPLRVRIGIESGPAVAGDFGTTFRSIYTAVGDSVNTASRLEQAAREFKHDIIVGAGTVERARRHRFILLGERMLRGKEKPTTLFTIDSSMDFAPRYTGQVAPALADPVTDGPA